MRRAAAALGTLLLAGCSIAASPSPPTTPVPSAAGSPSTGTSSPSATATATGALRFGLVTDDGLAFPSGLRLESDPSPFARIQARSVSISPDGRRLAYWHVPPGGDDTLGELRTVDLTTGVESTTLLSSAPDRAGGIAWRSDGSAVVVATASALLAFGGIDPPPAYTRVHTIDLTAGKARELARLDGARFQPIAWSAETKVVVGVDSGEGGVNQIFRIREDETRIAGGAVDTGYQRFGASHDGRREVVDDPYIIDARFVPTNEIAVLLRMGVPSRYALELWPVGLAGQGRRIWTSPNPAPYPIGDLFVRVDGDAVYVRGAEAKAGPSPWLRVDLRTGAASELPMASEPLSGLSFYVTDAAIAKLRR